MPTYKKNISIVSLGAIIVEEEGDWLREVYGPGYMISISFNKSALNVLIRSIELKMKSFP